MWAAAADAPVVTEPTVLEFGVLRLIARVVISPLFGPPALGIDSIAVHRHEPKDGRAQVV